jgi:hypothetical protein
VPLSSALPQKVAQEQRGLHAYRIRSA